MNIKICSSTCNETILLEKKNVLEYIYENKNHSSKRKQMQLILSNV
jgi:hypothetical protein